MKNTFETYLIDSGLGLSETELHDRYNEMLDDCYSFASVGGIFAHMSPSEVLKKCDEVAYRCGFSDWLDSEEYVEVGDLHFAPDAIDDAEGDFLAYIDNEARDMFEGNAEGETPSLDGLERDEYLDRADEAARAIVAEFRKTYNC